jgi:hypothetical protein
LPALLAAAGTNPYQERLWRAVHKALYAHLPDEFRWVEMQEGTRLEVLPGLLHTTEARVERHIALATEALGTFLDRPEWAHRP